MGTTKTVFNWDTEFDTANELMIHTMSDKVKVVANFSTNKAKVFVGGEEKNEIGMDISLYEYEQFLIRVARAAESL